MPPSSAYPLTSAFSSLPTTQVLKPPYSSLVFPTVANTDPPTQYCADVQLPANLLAGGAGFWGAHTLIFLTARPYPVGSPTVVPCKFEANYTAALVRRHKMDAGLLVDGVLSPDLRSLSATSACLLLTRPPFFLARSFPSV